MVESLVAQVTSQRQMKQVSVATIVTIVFAVAAWRVGAVPQDAGAVRIIQITYANWPTLTLRLAVLDQVGEPVLGLRKENFHVAVDGSEAADFSLSSVAEGRDDLAVAILVDSSGSMKGRPLLEAKAAAVDFITRLREQDRAAICSFESVVTMRTALTADKSTLTEQVEAIKAGGNTALRDAIVTALRTLASDKASRRAIVLLTDGLDTASANTKENLAVPLRDGAIPVYVIALGARLDTMFLEWLTESTSGEFFRAPQPQDLLPIYQKITRQLQNHYFLAVPVSNASNISHSLQIVVSSPGFEGVARKVFSVTGVEPVNVPTRPGRRRFIVLGLSGIVAGTGCGIATVGTILSGMRRRRWMAVVTVVLFGTLFGLIGTLIGTF
jgi:VWFA-related protein